MNYEQMNNNKVTLSGTIVEEPKFSHEVFGEAFFESKIAVPRLSEQLDILPITISEHLLKDYNISSGSVVSCTGQFRSYNKLDGEKSKLMLTVFIREIIETNGEIFPNEIELSGFICKSPMYRTTPFKREICDMLVAVNRAYNKSDYIPCIAWGRNARFVKNMQVGESVQVVGRIQSREYQKQIDENTTITKTAYEVSISRIVV